MWEIRQEVLGRTNRLLSFDMKRTAQETTSLQSFYVAIIGAYTGRSTDTRQPILLSLHIFVAAGMCLPSRCLARKDGYNLPILCLATIGRTHTQTHGLMEGIYEVHRWDGIRCHDIYTKGHKDWFRHSEFNRGRFTDTQNGNNLKPTLVFWK
jgi:hypothetical protein